MKELSITTAGKWILTGEHTVLRGGSALVFPFEGKKFNLNYFPIKEKTNSDTIRDLEIRAEFLGTTGPDYQILFYGLLDRCLELLQIDRSEFYGRYLIQSDLPLGGGLGASAALCVAVVQLLHQWGHVQKSQMYEMSRKLENLFHGESSGVDVAVALDQQPLYFNRSGIREPFQLKWKPKLFLSYSGEKGFTQACVEKVKSWINDNPELAPLIDAKMKQSVERSFSALTKDRSADSLNELRIAIDEAESSFRTWGLIPPVMQKEMDFLKSYGALAVKPTGSGGGGYILSLWSEAPPEQLLQNKLINCFM